MADARVRKLPDVPAELFVPPSREALFLLEHFGWLVSPADGRGSGLSRFIRMVMVAPFTQMTFFSFDLQVFLYDVFHQKIWAQAGHLIFMTCVVFFTLAGLSAVPLGPIDAGWLLAGALALWHVAVAASQRLWLWAAFSGAFALGLGFGAHVYAVEVAALGGASANPWLWMAASAVMIMLSHAPETRIPPRAVKGPYWRSVAEYVFGASGERRNPPSEVLRNGVRVVGFMVWGTFDEWWAAYRLMPYNYLHVLFKLGYAPALRRTLDERLERALASGNPAIDYVGIGGATFLELDRSASA